MRKRPLLLMACVFLAGIAYQRYSLKIIAVVGLLCIIRDWWIGRKAQSIAVLSAFLLGIFCMWQEMEFRAAYMSKIEDGSRITVWGELIKFESTEYGNRGILSDCYIRLDKETIPCNDIMMYTSKDQLQLGQIHKITGKVNMFSQARNEGNFDAFVYYQSLKIDFAVTEESCVQIGENTNLWRSALYSIKMNIVHVYNICLSEKASGFYQAMVLGDKKDLDERVKDLFLLGGISHILAISGLHVSILGRGMYRILRRGGVGFGIAGMCGGTLLIFYCTMVGSSTSTIRAVGMMLLFFLAQWIGRSYDMLNALGGMVLVLLWDNPFLIENSGFWFSVMALIGVGFVGRELSASKEYVDVKQKEGNRKWIKLLVNTNGLWMSLGITLTTLPVTALSYFEVSLYSPLVNCIVLPLLTPIFVLVVLGGLLGIKISAYGVLVMLFQPCEWMLMFYEWVCAFVSKLPASSIICGKPKWWQVVLYYLILFGGTYVIRQLSKMEQEKAQVEKLSSSTQRQSSPKKWCIINKRTVFSLIIFTCFICLFIPKGKDFEITFLDVGQGDGIYISAGDGTTYFIDGGSSSVGGVGENRILPFLKAKGVSAIDYWFVSHCDTDHVSGLLEILQKDYKIEYIVLHELCSSSENYLVLMNLADEKGIKVIHMEVGDRICSSDIEITCLAPWVENGQPIGEDGNENSLVLQVEWNRQEDEEKFKAIFAGDISTEVELALCERGLLEDVNLVKANHHGSNYSNCEKWFELLRPEYIVVSCSKTNIYGHPGEKAVERMEACGAEVFYTMDGGQITIRIEKGRIKLDEFKN